MPSETTAEDRQRGALLIAASLIAAIRLRGEPITHSPKVVSAISESCARNRAFAQAKRLAHVLSYGELPVIVYAPEAAGNRHGNFFDSSFATILKRPGWARRLDKIGSEPLRIKAVG